MTLDRWLLTGGSKRGWTAWLAAGVDYKRVKVVAPVVLSFLNMVENFHHYWRALGGWSFAMKDYYGENITETLDDPLNAEAQKERIFERYINLTKRQLNPPKRVLTRLRIESV